MEIAQAKKSQEKKALILPPDFYQHEDVIALAKSLLGKWHMTSFDGNVTSAITSLT